MSLLSVLKTVGKDLGHIGVWIDDGLKVAAPIVDVVDPPLAPLIAAIEQALDSIPEGKVLDANTVQQFVTASATVATVMKNCECRKNQ
jgi:hypothetical protein